MGSSRDHAPTSGSALDASGTVRRPGFARALAWADLDAFERGYIEASHEGWPVRVDRDSGAEFKPGFSDLAPETLAAILKDCEAFRAIGRELRAADIAHGGRFWDGRQQGAWRQFPPLTAHLGDDGKIHLRGSAEGVAASVGGQVPGRTK